MFGRFDACLYTLKHRKAFRQTEKNTYGCVSLRSYFHDLDKVFMYPILGVQLSHRIHTRFARHHSRCARTEKDFREMVIDWECARFTKPDKPLNAYDTLYKYYPGLESKILPILKRYGLDHKTEEGR